jgi:hypothetical protein
MKRNTVLAAFAVILFSLALLWGCSGEILDGVPGIGDKIMEKQDTVVEGNGQGKDPPVKNDITVIEENPGLNQLLDEFEARFFIKSPEWLKRELLNRFEGSGAMCDIDIPYLDITLAGTRSHRFERGFFGRESEVLFYFLIVKNPVNGNTGHATVCADYRLRSVWHFTGLMESSIFEEKAQTLLDGFMNNSRNEPYLQGEIDKFNDNILLPFSWPSQTVKIDWMQQVGYFNNGETTVWMQLMDKMDRFEPDRNCFFDNIFSLPDGWGRSAGEVSALLSAVVDH